MTVYPPTFNNVIPALIAAVGGLAAAFSAIGVASRAADQAEQVGNNFVYRFGNVADKAVRVGNVQLTEFNAHLGHFIKVGDNAVEVVDRNAGQVIQRVDRAGNEVIRIVDRAAAGLATSVDAHAGDLISIVDQAVQVVDRQACMLTLQVGEFLRICNGTVERFDDKTNLALQTVQLSASAIITLLDKRTGEAIDLLDRRAGDALRVTGMVAFFGLREFAHTAALGYTLCSLFIYSAFTTANYWWTLDIAATTQLLVTLVIVHHVTLYVSMARLRKLDMEASAHGITLNQAIANDSGALSLTTTDVVPTVNVAWVPGGECPAWLSLMVQDSLVTALVTFQGEELGNDFDFTSITVAHMIAICNYLGVLHDQNSFSMESVGAVTRYYE
ncbi:hypothetical protein HDU80_005878 [Chytriomyces hyalinus]|nr:hypothetical protein HDU80_005878 [Chytriomyces hyalinus]